MLDFRFLTTPYKAFQQHRTVYSLVLLTTAVVAVVFLLLPTQQVAGNTADELKEKIRAAEERIQKLQKAAGQYKTEITKYRSEAASLQEQVNAFTTQIQGVESEIALMEQEIATTRLYIEQTTLEINQNQALIEQKRTQIIQLFRTIYRQSNKTTVELVLENDSLSDFFDEIYAQESIQRAIQESVDVLKELQTALQEKKDALLLDEERLLKLEQDLEAQNQVLAQQRQVQQDLLTQTKNNQSNYEKLLADTRAQEKEFNEEIFKLEEALRQLLNPASLPTGTFQWPTIGTITQHYGCIHTSFARRSYSLCNNGKGGFHNGLDIGAPLGTSIFAVDNGTVAGSGSSRYGYGKWVAIRHGNNLVSVYAHLSSIGVSAGQSVSRGDVIGRMGSTGFSTGSHLHFIVYADGFKIVQNSRGLKTPTGATVNPFNYLPRTAVGAKIRP